MTQHPQPTCQLHHALQIILQIQRGEEMADLFTKQGRQYAAGRPGYPPQLFSFIASKTPHHRLAWDVGAGNGQAARSLAEIYENVVATDTSQNQLQHAPELPNVRYQHTPPIMSNPDVERLVAVQSTVDLVTVAQAMHWFDLPEFYRQVRHVLKRPQGVIAAWCYTTPEVNPALDDVFLRFYERDCGPYWEPARRLVDERYATIDFPFEAVDGEDSTGPFHFASEREMCFQDYMTYLRSWSAYQTAKEKGVELLGDATVEEFRRAWGGEAGPKKAVQFPVYLRIGKVGHSV